jgi:hypothetical protein
MSKKSEIAKEQKYIKDVRTVFSSLKYLGNGVVTTGDIKEEFDRLRISRSGRLFLALTQEAIDGGLVIKSGESTCKPSIPSNELFPSLA